MNLTQISKLISLILRHKPETIGITLDEHGWANVDELIRGVNIDFKTLEHIVATDDKQRYSFNEDKTLIRANQGHSISVDVELDEVQPPEFLWHGTAEKYEQDIICYGLIPKSRLYVHLSSDMQTAITVGKRHGNVVLLRVDALKMYEDGYKLYLSKNGVWLTKHVPTSYLSGVVLTED
jgi:putative RNA 2'-phosphotransferase